MRALAIDVGGSHAAAALVEDASIVDREHLPIPDAHSFANALPELRAMLQRLLDRQRLSAADCAGLAMSFPGIVDPDSGRIFSTPQGKYDDSNRLHLAKWSREVFGLPFRIDNDARMALLGEQYAGAARGSNDVVMITLGTGVGGAAMMHGRLLRGKHFQAACLGGHAPASFDGKPCICGGVGCVETEASTWALPGICRQWPGFATSLLAAEPTLDFAALFRCCLKDDAVALAIRDRCLRVWSSCAVGLIHAYDPDVLILGGAVMKSADQILPAVRAHVNAHAWTAWGKVQVLPARLGPEAALLGAVPLLSERISANPTMRLPAC